MSISPPTSWSTSLAGRPNLTPKALGPWSNTVVRRISRRFSWSLKAVARCIVQRLSHWIMSPTPSQRTASWYFGCSAWSRRYFSRLVDSDIDMPIILRACEAMYSVLCIPSGATWTRRWYAGGIARFSSSVGLSNSSGAASFRPANH